MSGSPLPSSIQPSANHIDFDLVRVLGEAGKATAGQPVLVLIGGIHGNEPGGVLAIREVLDTLNRQKIALKGQLIGVCGNIPALNNKIRFIHRDLNRNWYHSYLKELEHRKPDERSSEDWQQLELMAHFHQWADAGKAANAHPIIFFDLHSTSAPGIPFCDMPDTLRNRAITLALGAPIILGLEENINGSVLGYLNNRGYTTTMLEGGQNDDPTTVENMVSAIWRVLVQTGMVLPESIPHYESHINRMNAYLKGLPRVMSVVYRHPITPDDEFKMEAGYTNFQPIRRGEILAHDRRGPIASPADGYILMPLYQPQGEDGFFVVQAVSRITFWLSGAVRRLKFDQLLGAIPGVRRNENQRDAYRVSARIICQPLIQLFYLFGYRRHDWDEWGNMVFTRRRQDSDLRR